MARFRSSVWPVEVSDDDGYGKSDAKDATDGTEWGHQLAAGGPWRNVPVPCIVQSEHILLAATT